MEVWHVAACFQSGGQRHSFRARFADHAGGWSGHRGRVFEGRAAKHRKSSRGTRCCGGQPGGARCSGRSLGTLPEPGEASGNFVWRAALHRLPLSADPERSRRAFRIGASRIERQPGRRTRVGGRGRTKRDRWTAAARVRAFVEREVSASSGSGDARLRTADADRLAVGV